MKFFEKDNIDWSDPNGYTEFYHSLVELRKNNPALATGSYGGNIIFREDDNESVLGYTRHVEGNDVTVLLNMSDKNQTVSILGLEGEELDYFSGEKVSLNGQLTMKPFEYKVYIK